MAFQAFGGGVVAATRLLHTQNCGMSRDRGVATPWSATGGGVASAPLRFCPDSRPHQGFPRWWPPQQVEFSGLQKGPAERGHVKKRQKSSKSVKTFFDTFRQFSRRAKKSKIVKKCQKVFRQFSRGTFLPAPFAIR